MLRADLQGSSGSKRPRVDAIHLNSKDVLRRSTSHTDGICFVTLRDKIFTHSNLLYFYRVWVKIGKLLF